VWLKRRTPQNIVIGGAAGAVPPLVGWAAVTGGLDGTAVYLFAIVFFWTPPHFWALVAADEGRVRARRRADAARRARRGETRRQILLYSVLLYAVLAAAVLRRRLRDDLPRRLASCSARSSSAAPSLLSAAPTAARRCACTCSRWPTWPCCSARWSPTSSSRIADLMDRNLARKNVRTGLIVTAVCFFMFGMTFVAAAIYIS
jgi:hypothetical protein